MGRCCASCHLPLHDPHIRCQECSKECKECLICLECFSKGREFGEHGNDHPYSVVRHNFVLFGDLDGGEDKESCPLPEAPESPSKWTAEEELSLLNAIVQGGIGNWEDIAKTVGKKPFQCQKHFEQIYVENKTGLFPPSVDQQPQTVGRRRDQPVVYQAPCEIPYRPNPTVRGGGSHSGGGLKDAGGYHPARGEFEMEYMNSAERLLGGFSFDSLSRALKHSQSPEWLGIRNAREEKAFTELADGDDDAFANEDFGGRESLLENRLQLAACDVYRNTCKARLKRKRLVRELSLLNPTKAGTLKNRYHALINAGPLYEEIFKYRKLVCAFDFDYTLESLDREIGIRKNILHLQEFRENGLKRLSSASIYDRLKVRRETAFREVSSDTILDFASALNNGSVGRVSFVNNNEAGEVDADGIPHLPSIFLSGTKKLPPLMDIVNAPMYDKLDSAERKLCSEIRVIPENFLEVKDQLIGECKRSGGLTLAKARSTARIDVNRTRRIYDYLLCVKAIHAQKATN